MYSILITGANGYVGAKLCERLGQKGYSIVALSHVELPEESSWRQLVSRVINGDIRDPSIMEMLTRESIDAAIHLISLDNRRSEQRPEIVAPINVIPTWILLDRLSKHGLKKFIYFSSVQVYGNLPPSTIDEECRPAPRSAYGLTHLLSEQIGDYYHKKEAVVALNVRLSNAYGSPVFDDSNCWGLVVNDLCRSAFLNKVIKLESDGLPQRDFIHINDVTAAVELLIRSEISRVSDNTYHISSGETWSILEVARLIRRIYENRYGGRIHISFPDGSIAEDMEYIDSAQKYTIANMRMARLGFKPQVKLEDGVNELFSYLEARCA